MHDAISDEQLMLQYRDGDAQAFEILYTRHRKPVFGYLNRQCGNAAIAEELFQDIWMNLIRARERYEVTATFKTFIYRMAHNRLIDYYRKQKHGVPTSYDDQEYLLNTDDFAENITPERTVSAQENIEKLENGINNLPEAQREAFLLKETTGMSVEQIAEITGVNAETAKSRIRYAVNKLRKQLDLTI